MIRSLAVVVLLWFGMASAAAGHQSLLRAIPAEQARLSTLPEGLRLVFREPVRGVFTRILLLGPDSSEVLLGALRVEGDSGTTAFLPILGVLTAGQHTVIWRTTGADGHTVEGRYGFVVLADAVDPAASNSLPRPAIDDQAGSGGPFDHTSATLAVESAWYAVVRGANFLALLGLLGAVLFLVAVVPLWARDGLPLPDGLAHRVGLGVAAWGRTAAVILIIAGLGRLLAQGATMLTPRDPVTPAWLGALLTATPWGKGWLLQMTGGLGAWLGFRARQRGAGASAMVLVGVAAVALAVTPAMSGHAIATVPRTTLAVLADALHVLAAGGWMGGLGVLLLVGLPVIHREEPSERAPLVARLVQAFSPPALALGGVVAATGLIGAWLHLDTVSALWSTRYGQVLALKLGLVAMLFGLGGINFLRVRRRLGTDQGTATLRSSAGAELAVGILVLAVTAVLVALPPARREAPAPVAVPAITSPSSQE